MSTLVWHSSPPGHDHDDNCLKRVYVCKNGHDHVLSERRRCPAVDCGWIGKSTCFDTGEKLDRWPTPDVPGGEGTVVMSWASDKAREALETAFPGFNADDPPFTLVRSVERAVCETIEKCAEAAAAAGTCNDGYDCTVAWRRPRPSGSWGNRERGQGLAVSPSALGGRALRFRVDRLRRFARCHRRPGVPVTDDDRPPLPARNCPQRPAAKRPLAGRRRPVRDVFRYRRDREVRGYSVHVDDGRDAGQRHRGHDDHVEDRPRGTRYVHRRLRRDVDQVDGPRLGRNPRWRRRRRPASAGSEARSPSNVAMGDGPDRRQAGPRRAVCQPGEHRDRHAMRVLGHRQRRTAAPILRALTGFARPDERATCQACRIASGLSPTPIDNEMEALLREETKSTLCLLAPLSGPGQREHRRPELVR
jgi:hypothetical protein